MSGEYKISSRFGFLNKHSSCIFTNLFSFTGIISQRDFTGYFDENSFQLFNKNSKEIFINIPNTFYLIICINIFWRVYETF